jgi:hypothetical protein
VVQVKRKVARVLDFEEHQEFVSYDCTKFIATPSTPKQKRSRKARAPLVQPAQRRFTCSLLKSDGYKPRAVLDGEPKKKKKKSRAKVLVVNQAQLETDNSEAEFGQNVQKDQETEEIPVTPIVVTQNVGMALGIPPEKLTKEQLEAGPNSSTKKKLDNV